LRPRPLPYSKRGNATMLKTGKYAIVRINDRGSFGRDHPCFTTRRRNSWYGGRRPWSV
jgi:hypothetical protein